MGNAPCALRREYRFGTHLYVWGLRPFPSQSFGCQRAVERLGARGNRLEREKVVDGCAQCQADFARLVDARRAVAVYPIGDGVFGHVHRLRERRECEPASVDFSLEIRVFRHFVAHLQTYLYR